MNTKTVKEQNLKFDLQPRVGALPITFGMKKEEVHRLLGSPESSHPTWDDSGSSDFYSKSRYNVGYNKKGLVNHLGFSPGGAELTGQLSPLPGQTNSRDFFATGFRARCGGHRGAGEPNREVVVVPADCAGSV